MSPQYWQKVFLKTAIFLLVSMMLSTSIKAQENSAPPGIIETVQELLRIQRDQFSKLKDQVSTNPMALSNIKDDSQIKLERYFSRYLLFHSESKYLNLIQNNQCNLYSLLQNDLLKHSQGEVNSVFITIDKKSEERQSAQVDLENFLQIIYKNKCSQNKDLATLFNNSNIKGTVASINMPTPKSLEDCRSIIESWQRNPYTPFMCHISESIKEGGKARAILPQIERGQLSQRRALREKIRKQEFYQGEIPHFQRTYIANMCENLDSANGFCSVYLAKDVWNQILNGEHPDWKMSYKCRNILNKEATNINDLKVCAADFNKNPNLCMTKGTQGLPSLFPLLSCDTYSETLKISKLKTDYHDCPARIENEGITNISRLIQHFNPTKQEGNFEQTCASSSLIRFVELNLNYENQQAWPLRLCYDDRVTEKEVCLPFIPGHHNNHSLAENQVVADILVKNFGARENTECQIIDNSSYNPLRLEYKSGCYIIYDLERCSALNCERKIVLDKKNIQGISSKGKPLFDYFPNSFGNRKFAVDNILRETFRLETKALRNLTELSFFLKNIEGGIVHGIGCAEDLLPRRFKRQNLNQCSPMPFIVDGVHSDEMAMTLSVRPSVSDLHSPMPIHWNYVYSAVVNYQELHPIKSWTLYGLRR